MLAEIGDDRERFGDDAQGLQCLGGTAPVTKRSGKQRKYWHVHQRWACDKHLRHTLHLFAEQSLSRCVWAELYYQHHRQKNQSHANALLNDPDLWGNRLHRETHKTKVASDRGARPILAGRNLDQSPKKFAEPLGLSARAFDLGDPERIDAAIKDVSVVLCARRPVLHDVAANGGRLSP